MFRKVIPGQLAVLLICAWCAPEVSSQFAHEPQTGQFQLPDLVRIPLAVPPAGDDFRGLLADIDARFNIVFRSGQVVQVVPLEVRVATPYDPLPEGMELQPAVVRWGQYTLRSWRAGRLDPFETEVILTFRVDASLSDEAVDYRVFFDPEGPDSSVEQPCRIVIKAPPKDVDQWAKVVEGFREHERALLRRRQGGEAPSQPQ